jgi:hypothetical protein
MRRKVMKVRRRGKVRNTMKSKDLVISKDMSRIARVGGGEGYFCQCRGWWRE